MQIFFVGDGNSSIEMQIEKKNPDKFEKAEGRFLFVYLFSQGPGNKKVWDWLLNGFRFLLVFMTLLWT